VLSYTDLNRRANRMAHLLVRKGLMVGDLVGLNLPKSVDAVAAILAILKAGGAYLPRTRLTRWNT
jgi:acyl-coenzyme A synthetase/AMP-(fatty) acid ligase